jgi:hypothetical protein
MKLFKLFTKLGTLMKVGMKKNVKEAYKLVG